MGSFDGAEVYKSWTELEKTKKKICRILKDNGLNIIIETNLYIKVSKCNV